MVVSSRNKGTDEPYKCEDCGAMVFVSPRLHGVLCYNYKRDQDLVRGSFLYFQEFLGDKVKEEMARARELADKKAIKSREAAEKRAAKKRNKEIEENNDLPLEQATY